MSGYAQIEAIANNSAPTYAVKCHDCNATVRTTTDVRESYAGTRCETCRARCS